MDFFVWEKAPDEDKLRELPNTKNLEEEYIQFQVDEHLSDFERIIVFLRDGHPIQFKLAIESIPTQLRARGKQAWEQLFPLLKTALNRADAEAQMATALTFATIIRERLLTGTECAEALLPIILKNISKDKTEEEMDAWLSAIYEISPLVDKGTLRNDVLALALSKGEVDESVLSRTTSCKILGALAPHLSREDIERTFFKKSMAMCQDTDYQVRICMCQQLNAIARTIGRELTQQKLLEELFELINDEEVQVRVVAVQTLVSLIDMLLPEARRTMVMPVLRRLMHPIDMEAAMQRCIAKLLGQIVVSVAADFEPEDPGLFFGCYRHLAARSDVELRRLCASQFPAMVKASSAAHFASFNDTFHNLAVDSDQEVRRIIAAQFHEIARMLGRELCTRYLGRTLLSLLRDEKCSVKAEMLPWLSITFTNFLGPSDERRESFFSDVCSALSTIDTALGHNWRLQLALISAFPSFPNFFSPEQLHDYFLPLAFKWSTASATAVKMAAADSIASIFRACKREKQRTETLGKLIREYALSKSCFGRLAFVEICYCMQRRFSTKFFKEYLLDLCLDMLYDPVPNIRLYITKLLPCLKQTIRLPEDVEQLERLNSAMSNLMTDNDRDVSHAARTVHEQYKRIPVRMTCGAGVLDMNGLAGGQSDFETEDRRKEEEEVDFTFIPEDVERLKADMDACSRKRKQHCFSDGPLSAGRRPAAPAGKAPSPTTRGRSKADDEGMGAMSPSGRGAAGLMSVAGAASRSVSITEGLLGRRPVVGPGSPGSPSGSPYGPGAGSPARPAAASATGSKSPSSEPSRNTTATAARQGATMASGTTSGSPARTAAAAAAGAVSRTGSTTNSELRLPSLTAKTTPYTAAPSGLKQGAFSSAISSGKLGSATSPQAAPAGRRGR